jgi:two-component system, LytTR family, response regulator
MQLDPSSARIDCFQEALAVDFIRTLIVDDEPLARENLRIRLHDIADFEIVGECGTGRDTVAGIIQHRPDLVFLDIRMPDMDGFGVLERVEPEFQPVVVFVTAYDRFALEAFRVHALDYLLKPFDEERFAETLQACRQRVAELRRLEAEGDATAGAPLEAEGAPPALALSPGNPYYDRLVIKHRGRVFFLRIDALDWIEACGDYVNLHAADKAWLLRRTMNEMEARLDPRAFVRISRSAIVRLDRVQELLPTTRGEHLVRLHGGRELKLTRLYREKLESLLGDRL